MCRIILTPIQKTRFHIDKLVNLIRLTAFKCHLLNLLKRHSMTDKLIAHLDVNHTFLSLHQENKYAAHMVKVSTFSLWFCF